MKVDKRKDFKQILLQLAESQSFLKSLKQQKKFCSRFDRLYDEGNGVYFRHYYSDIFQVLMQLQRDNTLGSMETLAANLSWLVENYQTLHTNGNDISICLKKLNDHVSLEMARFNYFEQQYNNTKENSDLKELYAKVEELKQVSDEYYPQIDDLKQVSDEYYPQIDDLKQKLNSAQQEYVAILGVFAAVILAFVGGITFSSSVLQNIASVSIYRLLLTVDLLGFILINTISLLLNFICHILGKEKKSYFPIKWVNITCFVLATLILFAWAFNFDKVSYYIDILLGK